MGRSKKELEEKRAYDLDGFKFDRAMANSQKTKEEKKDYIEYNGKRYEDVEEEYYYMNYSLIQCPKCSEKLLFSKEKENEPGFRCSYKAIEDKICECDIEEFCIEISYYEKYKNNK